MTAAVLGHLALSGLHGLVHGAIPVHVLRWQLAYASAMLFLAPVVALLITKRGCELIGGFLLVCAGLASLSFEGIFHFVVANPDHVLAGADGHAAFAGTALLSTLGDLVLLIAGVWVLRDRSSRRFSPA